MESKDEMCIIITVCHIGNYLFQNVVKDGAKFSASITGCTHCSGESGYNYIWSYYGNHGSRAPIFNLYQNADLVIHGSQLKHDECYTVKLKGI